VRRPGADVLDVGCGWGGTLRRLSEAHDTGRAVGLTLSRAQHDFIAAHPIGATDIRLESWADHEPVGQYDAIVSYGAFEHFAHDGTTSVERIRAYRRFFGSCFEWLKPGGRLGLETITHDGAPDTDAPLGRGPLGDRVSKSIPSRSVRTSARSSSASSRISRSKCFAPRRDFARTTRLWHLALRAHHERAVALVGAETVRRFRRYLVSSEMQFRTNTIAELSLRPAPSRRFAGSGG
jgi:cyclopropane-fatty-acyl-phospholipid synthase